MCLCRSYGADAYSLLTRRPEKTYARLSTLLGKHDEHPAVALLDQSYFPTKVHSITIEERRGEESEHSKTYKTDERGEEWLLL